MKKVILLGFFAAIVVGSVRPANADFTFGEPTNLGPTVNSEGYDDGPCLSADGLELYFNSSRPGGYGGADLWVATRPTEDDPWGEPVNLGPPVNSQDSEGGPNISADGLSLYFGRGAFPDRDIYVTTRKTKDDDWGEPVNLDPTVNSSVYDFFPTISADGLVLFFRSDRAPGGDFSGDMWVTRRKTVSDPWGPPVYIGPIDESGAEDYGLEFSADGTLLYFHSERPSGIGAWDLWQVKILPVVDFNGDGIVDYADMYIMVDHWGENYPLCDIGPMPWGDGIVDIQDLIVLVEHLFERIPPVEPEEVNVDENDDGSQVELEQGQILVVTLESNPTTGYRWEVAEIQESILEQMGEAEFEPSETGEPPFVGAGGWEIFRFEAISAGQMTLQLVYRRSWEEGVEPINTFSIEVVVN